MLKYCRTRKMKNLLPIDNLIHSKFVNLNVKEQECIFKIKYYSIIRIH